MTVAFFSNFFNHHQKPISDELYKLIGDNYTFIATIAMPENFIKSGYDIFETPYLLNAYKNETNYKKAQLLALEADVVIFGAAPESYIKARLKKNKLTFRYSERIFKKSKWQKFNPRAIIHQYKKHSTYRAKKVHMLCASAYTANDLEWIYAYPNKMYKWGYFTKTSMINIEKILTAKRNRKFTILYVARLIDWKHPEMAIKLALLLKEKKYNFELNIIGSGEMEESIKKSIEDNKLTKNITLLGNVNNEKVLYMMQDSHAFFFPSDRNEGWGAVANEAMANGCTIVASHEIGAIPYLITPNKNGLVFKSGDINDAFKQIEKIIVNPIFCESLATKAYEKITKIWSPKNAATNFLTLASLHLKSNNNILPEIGPCSLAYSTDNNWYKK